MLENPQSWSSERELGTALRAWRHRCNPEDYGLRLGGRRTPGLRRDELAYMAGISVDYIIQLEQGRASAPSVQVLQALARALRLTDIEEEHLLHLSGRGARAAGDFDLQTLQVTERLTSQLDSIPVAIYDLHWSPVSWNPMWVALMGDPLDRSRDQQNLLLGHFSGVRSRIVRSEAEREVFEESIVADLRATVGMYPHDTELRALVEELLLRSSRFRTLWEARNVSIYAQERKMVEHPSLGLIPLEWTVLNTQMTDLRVGLDPVRRTGCLC